MTKLNIDECTFSNTLKLQTIVRILGDLEVRSLVRKRHSLRVMSASKICIISSTGQIYAHVL